MNPIWQDPTWIANTQLLLDSYRALLGEQLIARLGSPLEQSRQLFEAPRVVVAHGTQDDPVFFYGNRVALELWEVSLQTLLATPSKQTAEPMHREERARLLDRTTRDGYVDDYHGIRISRTGKRFEIEQAVVWNLSDQQGNYAGQAATFTQWRYLSP